MTLSSLAGRRALVTGASRGIGRSIARHLGELGADVALVARSAGDLERVRDELVASGRRAIAIPADLGTPESPARVVERVTTEFGGLDIVVNNAGITRDALIARMSDEQWQTVIDTNLAAAFRLCRAAVRPLLKSGKGRILNIASVVGITGNAGQVNYAASKGGLIALSKSLALELASRKITVNVVAPGFISTDMTSEMAPAARDGALAGIPLGRFGAPEDIASLVGFLAGDAATYITGQVIAVDGGMTMG